MVPMYGFFYWLGWVCVAICIFVIIPHDIIKHRKSKKSKEK